MSSRRQRPLLKNTVDLQLQNAFNDGNWPAVIRLVDRKTKTSPDAYLEVCPLPTSSSMLSRVFSFSKNSLSPVCNVIALTLVSQALKVCAESHLDSPVEKCAAVVAVDALVRSGKAPADIEVLPLYEWACYDVRPALSYAETFGLLRLRWSKANPRSPAVLHCLQSCVRSWDLVNAQQVCFSLS